MCDTLWKSMNGNSVFLKNSDRSVNEPNLLLWSEARNGNGKLDLTYITIDDAPSYSSILYKPSWIWGAEMGINEKGVAIGNEAVFTKSRHKKTPSIIGMDYVRLGLERGASARESMDAIIALFRQYGQGGNCGYDKEFYYDNSYLICDSREAYVLETAGRDYIYKKLEGRCNISNRLSIGTDYDAGSRDGNFLKSNTEWVYTFFSGSLSRSKLGAEHLSRVDAADFSQCLDILRVHHRGQENAIKFGSLKSICMHSGSIDNQSTGSLAVFYRDGRPFVFASGSSTPCLSVFKPLMPGFECGPLFRDPAKSYAYWLKRETLNRALFSNIISIDDYTRKARRLENTILDRAGKLAEKTCGDNEWKTLCESAAAEEEAFINSYDEYIRLSREKSFVLAPYWQQKTESMGKHVFERDLKKRISP